MADAYTRIAYQLDEPSALLDLPPEARRARFEALLPDLRWAAWQKGYAVAVHGSLARDMDLIAVPWIENAASAEQLAEALATAVSGNLHPRASQRAHGRTGFLIYPPFAGHNGAHSALGYIDLAVTPRG